MLFKFDFNDIKKADTAEFKKSWKGTLENLVKSGGYNVVITFQSDENSNYIASIQAYLETIIQVEKNVINTIIIMDENEAAQSSLTDSFESTLEYPIDNSSALDDIVKTYCFSLNDDHIMDNTIYQDWKSHKNKPKKTSSSTPSRADQRQKDFEQYMAITANNPEFREMEKEQLKHLKENLYYEVDFEAFAKKIGRKAVEALSIESFRMRNTDKLIIEGNNRLAITRDKDENVFTFKVISLPAWRKRRKEFLEGIHKPREKRKLKWMSLFRAVSSNNNSNHGVEFKNQIGPPR
ncbi:MAG: hypothetical protein EPO11_06890 [Gammaproteobacteria bacterium]|nr:MAG: hypothetical protein EPO11_06890 [Gammaproteobacteria bacterium]